MEKSICEECKKEYSPIIEGIQLCAKCDEKNWTSDPLEMARLMKEDPVLRKGQIIHELKDIIFKNSRKGTFCDDLKDGQILGLRTGEGLEFDSLANGLYEYVNNNQSK